MREISRSNKLHDLLLKGKYQKYTTKQTIQSSIDGSAINLVLSGFIKRYQISNDGRIGVQILYGPGDVYPLTLIFRSLFEQEIYQGPEVYYYETMGTVEIKSIDNSILQKQVKDNPKLYEYLMQEAGRHLQCSIQRLENLELRNSYKRVAHQLAFYASDFGEKKNAAITITAPLTHQDIADILSMTRETVSLSIEKLQKKGLVKNNRYIIVPDIAKLEEEAFS